MPTRNPTSTRRTGDAKARKHRAALQAACDKMVRLGAAGVQFRVAKNGNEFVVTSGVARVGDETPVPENGRFRIACITKTFVATVVLQLAAEGKLDIDAPISTYLPGLIPDGDKIMIRNLLQHTSGLYNHADSFQRPGERFLRDRYKQYGMEELVRVAAKLPLNFEPGTKFEYSNTNYIVIGLLINKITGHGYAEEIEQRVLRPLGLADTYLPGNDPEIEGPHAHGYMKIKGRTEDVTVMNPSEACSAGEMISTTADLDRFLLALINREILDERQFAEMCREQPPGLKVNLPMAEAYGLGFMRMGTDAGLPLWGHGGGIPGYATFAGTTVDGTTRLVTSITLDLDPDSFVGDFEDSVAEAINVAVSG